MERPELSAHLGAAVLSACQPLTTIPIHKVHTMGCQVINSLGITHDNFML
eukprot:c45097_g1_i1 orf=132-281(+)